MFHVKHLAVHTIDWPSFAVRPLLPALRPLLRLVALFGYDCAPAVGVVPDELFGKV